MLLRGEIHPTEGLKTLKKEEALVAMIGSGLTVRDKNGHLIRYNGEEFEFSTERAYWHLTCITSFLRDGYTIVPKEGEKIVEFELHVNCYSDGNIGSRHFTSSFHTAGKAKHYNYEDCQGYIDQGIKKIGEAEKVVIYRSVKDD